MPAFSLQDLTTPVSRDEVKESIYRVLGALGVRTSWWGTGAVVRTFIVGVSAVIAANSQLQAYIAKSGFLDLSEGDWLTNVARFVYGVDRIEATYATGQVQLHNTGGGLYAQDAGEYVVSNPSTGKSYRNIAAFTLSPGATISIGMSAVEAGADSSAATGTITDQVTVLTGVEVTNLDTFVGLDEEKDAALRARCREKLGALSPMGPWDAYAFAARTAKRADGTPAGVTRTRTIPDGFGNLQVVVASASGAVGGTIGDLTTDLGAIDDAISKNAEPLSVAALAVSATAYPVNVVYEAWAYNTIGMTAAQLKSAVRDALTAFMSTLPIGGAKLAAEDAFGYVFADAVRAAIANTSPAFMIHVALTSPASDVSLTSTQVPTLVHNPSTDATIHLVTPPAGVAL